MRLNILKARKDPFSRPQTISLSIQTARGLGFTAGYQIIQFIVQMLSMVLMARMLSPDDYGLIAMVMIFINFLEMFKDAGLSFATIQKKTITKDQVSNLFWVNVLVSSILTLILISSSPLIAAFYQEPRLEELCCILSINFMIGGSFVQHQALLKREMRFKALAACDLAALLFSTLGGLFLAYIGWGYWAIVGAAIINQTIQLLTKVFICAWVPTRPKRGTEIYGLLKFGADLTAFSFINFFSRNADDVIIGKLFGTQELGLYNRAYGLMLHPLQQVYGPLQSVLLPALCRINENKQLLQQKLFSVSKIVAMSSMLPIALVTLHAETVVTTLLGPGWRDVVIYFQIIGIAGIFQPLNITVNMLFIVTGHTEKQLRWAVFTKPLMILAFVLGSFWGPVGVAYGYLVTSLVFGQGGTIYALRCAQMPVARFYTEVFLLPFLLSITLFMLHISLICFVISLILATTIGVHQRNDIRDLFLEIILIFKKTRNSAF